MRGNAAHQVGAKPSVECARMVSNHLFCRLSAHITLAFYAAVRYQAVMTDESIENLARKLAESVPEGLRSMGADLESNFRGVLRASLAKLDLVTREEFEVQEAVLARTREKLEVLEARLEQLEND